MTEKPECNHAATRPVVTDDQLKGLTPEEVREKYPRFDGPCPDCGELVIAYASAYHYFMGDW